MLSAFKLRFVTASAPVITGFAYPAETLTSTAAGQWYVAGSPVSGETGSTYVVRLTDIGKTIAQINSNTLTCWSPADIAAVARFRAAILNDLTLTSISPDTPATNGQTIRRVKCLITGENADQTTGTFQPIYRTAGVGGYPSWEFDGSNDRLFLPAGSDVFQNRSQGYLIAGCTDTNPTAAANHTVIQYSVNAAVSSRMGLFASTTATRFSASVRRLDSDTPPAATVANNGNYNVLATHGDFSNGFARLRVNGSVVASGALPSGSGNTPNNTSLQATIGNIEGVGGFVFPGHITALCEINATISATDLSRIERYIGLLGGLTTIPLV